MARNVNASRAMRLRRFVMLLTSASLSAACANQVTALSGGEGTGGNAGGGAGGKSASSGGAITSASSSSGPQGVPCGEGDGGGYQYCQPGQYCDWGNHQCQPGLGFDYFGACKPLPKGCASFQLPMCGCDNKLAYDNACAAMGEQLHACPAPKGKFYCGQREYAMCDISESYCEQVYDPGGSFTCRPLPQACGKKGSCACLAKEPCAKDCVEWPDGSVRTGCFK